VSEQAEGTWTSDGKAVRLTTSPKPKAPDFEVIRDDPAPNGQLIVLLAEPYQGWNGPISGFAVTRFSGEPLDLDADEQGRTCLDSAGVKAIVLKIPVYGGISSQIPISPGRGHRLVVRFRANDLGIAAFDNEPLSITPRGLVLNRYDQAIRFIRVRP
jgi:hypothetical protein